MACFNAGASALGSLAETTMALTCCAVRLLIQVTWSDALAEDGPTCLNDPLRAVGRNTILRLLPVLPGVLPPLLVLLPPQPARTNSTNTKNPGPSVRNSFFTVSSSFRL